MLTHEKKNQSILFFSSLPNWESKILSNAESNSAMTTSLSLTTLGNQIERSRGWFERRFSHDCRRQSKGRSVRKKNEKNWKSINSRKSAIGSAVPDVSKLVHTWEWDGDKCSGPERVNVLSWHVIWGIVGDCWIFRFWIAKAFALRIESRLSSWGF